MDGEKKLPRRALIVVGGASVILGLIGIAFNVFTLFRDYTSVLQEVKGEVAPDQFYTAFYIMSGICLSLYTALLVIGIQLIRQRSRWAFGLLGVMALEVLYYLATGVLWRSSQYRLSIAAATGISSGALIFQAIVLFPIWGPWIAIWSHRKLIQTAGSTVNNTSHPSV
jgi:hypothetical protein